MTFLHTHTLFQLVALLVMAVWVAYTVVALLIAIQNRATWVDMNLHTVGDQSLHGISKVDQHVERTPLHNVDCVLHALPREIPPSCFSQIIIAKRNSHVY